MTHPPAHMLTYWNSLPHIIFGLLNSATFAYLSAYYFHFSFHIKLFSMSPYPILFIPHPRSPSPGPTWMSRSQFGWENPKKFQVVITPPSTRHSVTIGKNTWLSNTFPLRLVWHTFFAPYPYLNSRQTHLNLHQPYLNYIARSPQ